MMWSAVSIFQAEPTDGGKSFEQRVAVENDKGTVLLGTPISLFNLKVGKHRIVNQVNGMPIGSAGLLLIKCYLREKGAHDWREMGSYSISIKWQTAPVSIIH